MPKGFWNNIEVGSKYIFSEEWAAEAFERQVKEQEGQTVSVSAGFEIGEEARNHALAEIGDLMNNLRTATESGDDDARQLAIEELNEWKPDDLDSWYQEDVLAEGIQDYLIAHKDYAPNPEEDPYNLDLLEGTGLEEFGQSRIDNIADMDNIFGIGTQGGKQFYGIAGRDAMLNRDETEEERKKREERANLDARGETDVLTTPVMTPEEIAAKPKEFASLARTAYQCYLIHNLEPLADFHRDKLEVMCGWGENAAASSVYYKKKLSSEEYESEPRLILVDDKDVSVSHASVNKMTSLGKVQNMNTILPHEYSQLMPMLNIYKIYRVKGEEVGKVKMTFDNKTDLGLIEGEDVFKEISGRTFAKGSGNGVKSFNWSFIGGDPFTATKDLKATMKLYFQDFRELVKVRNGPNLFTKAQENLEYRYLDLVLQPDCRELTDQPENIEVQAGDSSLDYTVYHPECYEVAVETGYRDASTEGLSDDLKLLIKNQKTTMYLTVVDHTFNVEQDGTFSLSVEFRARLATALGDKGMNVLIAGGGNSLRTSSGDIGELMFNMNEVDSLIKKKRKQYGTTKKEGSSYSQRKASDELSKLETLRQLVVERSHRGLYAGIVTTLMQESLVYKIKISQKDFNQFSRFAQYDRTKAGPLSIDKEGTSQVAAEDVRTAGDADVDANKSLLSPGQTGLTQVKKGFGGPFGSVEEITQSSSEAEDALQASRLVEANRQSDHTIYFTTLGDIVGVITEHVLGESSILPGGAGNAGGRAMNAVGKEEIETMLRDIDLRNEDGSKISDELLYDKISDVSFSSDSRLALNKAQVPLEPAKAAILDGFRVLLGCLTYTSVISEQPKATCLASLPVAMEMFQTFMNEHVISSQRTFYSYQEFVKDLLNDVVLSSMSNECFGGYFTNKAKASVSLFEAKGIGKFPNIKEPIAHGGNTSIYGAYGEGYTFKTLKMQNAQESNLIFPPVDSTSVTPFSYLQFSAHSLADFDETLHGDFEEDRKNGIPHFMFGAAQGFLKTAKFNKTPIEYLPEQRYAREGSSNMFNQLAGKYEMQLNMVGNNLFIPGQYIYFDPVAMGIGRPNQDSGGEARSFSNRMGLGGYHIITEVGCSITPGKFETTISSLWETSGKLP